MSDTTGYLWKSKFPTGTVTFLFSDIEGSTQRWERQPSLMQAAFARQEAIMRSVMAAHGGYVYKMIGDAFQVAFATASAALSAALEAQRLLHTENWGEIGPIRVRIALHTGVTEERGDDYVGPLLNRVARLMSAGHGGQVLISQATYELVHDCLPDGASLRDLGEHKLKDISLPMRIFQAIASEVPGEFPPLRALDVFPNNLPAQLTSFIGREREIDELKQLLASTRLLTLNGSGGIGKTRLCLRVAGEILGAFKDGVWFVELASITDPDLVPNAVANVLSVHEEPGHPTITTLLDWLSAKELLLLLDNCEHLIGACAGFSEAVLHTCHRVHILTSSREPLGIAGETTYRVPSLQIPDTREQLGVEQLETNPSVRLFNERAIQTTPAFRLTQANASTVAKICSRLDGIPLAIELAAARVKVLAVEQIAKRLDDRFRLLTGGSRTALPRQQTLRALIDWSYDLLNQEEQLLFRRLAVFVGGWTIEAAEAVCSGEGLETDDILDLLTHLVDKSLIGVENFGEVARYHRLETIRQYAREKLFETPEAASRRDGHLEYFLQLAEQAAEGLNGREQMVWLRRLEAEHDNLNAALEWSLGTQPELGLRLAAALSDFWDIRAYYSEAHKWLEVMLDVTRHLSPTPATVRAVLGEMMSAARQSKIDRWRELVKEELTLARTVGDQWGIAQGLSALGVSKEQLDHDLEGAQALYREALAIHRQLGDKLSIGQALGRLASCALARYDYAMAEELFRESLALFREVENNREIAGALWNLAEVALSRRNYEAARASAEESLTLCSDLEDKHGVATGLRTLSLALLNLGNIEQGWRAVDRSVNIFRRLGDRACLGITLPVLARYVLTQGDLPLASNLAQEGATILHEVGYLTMESSALDICGRIALEQRDVPKAKEYFQDGLKLQQKIKDARQTPPLLEGLACVMALSSQPNEAAQLMGASEALREKIGLKMTPIEHPEYNLTISILHARIGAPIYQKMWAEGRLLAMEEAIRFAIEKINLA